MLVLAACSTSSGGDVRAGSPGSGDTLVADGSGAPPANGLGAQHETASGNGTGFSEGGSGGESLLGGPGGLFDEQEEWNIVPFTDPSTGQSYDIIDGRVIVTTKLYTPLPVVDGNFYDSASAVQLQQFYNQCSYPSTLLTNLQVTAFLAAENLTCYSEWPEVGGLAVTLPEGTSVLTAVQTWPLLYPNLIQSVGPDVAVGGAAFPADQDPNDDLFPQQWHINEEGGSAYHIRAQAAWRENSANVTAATTAVVAVLDTGVDFNTAHLPDLSARSTQYGCNTGDKRASTTFTTRSSGGGRTWQFLLDRSWLAARNCGHGTCSAGIIAGAPNNDHGSAPPPNPPDLDDGQDVAGVSLVPAYFPVAIKYLGDKDSFSLSAILNALTAVGCVQGRYSKSVLYGPNFFVPSHRIEVVNMSLGGPINFYDGVASRHFAELGPYMLFVASAGNKDTNLPQWPSNDINVMGVAAHNSTGQRSQWGTEASNYSSACDTSAPGTLVYSVDMWGVNSFNQTLGYAGTGSPDWSISETYYPFRGTSAAAPVVSGVAILVTVRFPNLTPNGIWSRITATEANDLQDSLPAFNQIRRVDCQAAME